VAGVEEEDVVEAGADTDFEATCYLYYTSQINSI
jgi:hypothetical protein